MKKQLAGLTLASAFLLSSCDPATQKIPFAYDSSQGVFDGERVLSETIVLQNSAANIFILPTTSQGISHGYVAFKAWDTTCDGWDPEALQLSSVPQEEVKIRLRQYVETLEKMGELLSTNRLQQQDGHGSISGFSSGSLDLGYDLIFKNARILNLDYKTFKWTKAFGYTVDIESEGYDHDISQLASVARANLPALKRLLEKLDPPQPASKPSPH